MTTQAFYRAALLGPLLGMSVAFVLDRVAGSRDLTPGHSLMPDSLTRGLVAYAVVAGWLWIQLGRRSEAEFRRQIWQGPLLYLAVSGALVLGFAALRGWLDALWPEHAGVLLLRTTIHLGVGYGYLALVHVALARLRASGTVQAVAPRPS
jgi:hypothetical protein